MILDLKDIGKPNHVRHGPDAFQLLCDWISYAG